MLSYTIQQFEKTTTINIELIDNSFTNRWKDYLVRTIKRLPNLSWSTNTRSMCSYNTSMNPINHFNKLKQTFEILQEYYKTDYLSEIIELNHLIENPKNLKQSHLNCWHRHFTTNAVKFLTSEQSNITFAIINVLNESTHELEILTHGAIERRVSLKDKAFYGICSANSKNLKDIESLWMDGNKELLGEDFTFDNDYNHTVWIGDDIQGKEHVKCWYDEDDPSYDDIWGNTFMTPNILLDPNMIYAGTMDNPEFKKFVIDSHKPINRYPIGDILDIEKVDWSSVDNGKLIFIVLDGETLWESS
jgi:hypothetical protein